MVRTPPQILIADDNPENLDIFQTRLAVHGYEILTATDGEQALAIAREKQPDLILLDVMMPKMDGIEVCRRLKAQPVQLAEWNRTLEQRVQEQVAQLERLGRLKRFFSPQLAELIVAGGAGGPPQRPPRGGAGGLPGTRG